MRCAEGEGRGIHNIGKGGDGGVFLVHCTLYKSPVWIVVKPEVVAGQPQIFAGCCGMLWYICWTKKAEAAVCR